MSLQLRLSSPGAASSYLKDECFVLFSILLMIFLNSVSIHIRLQYSYLTNINEIPQISLTTIVYKNFYKSSKNIQHLY